MNFLNLTTGEISFGHATINKNTTLDELDKSGSFDIIRFDEPGSGRAEYLLYNIDGTVFMPVVLFINGEPPYISLDARCRLIAENENGTSFHTREIKTPEEKFRASAKVLKNNLPEEYIKADAENDLLCYEFPWGTVSVKSPRGVLFVFQPVEIIISYL